MKYVDEFRDPALARRLIREITRRSTHPVQLMEFCGGHTHAISRLGLRHVLPAHIHLRSGPGCPVCVTSAADLEQAIILAHMPGAIVTTYGDMIRVPGSRGSLQEARAGGADVRMVYSTLDTLDIARQNPDRQVIWIGVGFETTAPMTAAAIWQAEQERLSNWTVLCLHKLTPPATRAILDAGEVRLDGVIGPGHVTTVIGAEAWRFLPDEYGLSCVIAGFEPLDILRSIYTLVTLYEEGRAEVQNTYGRSVQARGNPQAQEMMERVFQVGAAAWRGFGSIPDSGLALRPEYAHRDAAIVFASELARAVDGRVPAEPKGCRCGHVLRGIMEPPECPLYRRVCSPRTPVGPCMVSAEGACAAYYQYGAGMDEQ